jgi:hypothetical protein
MDKSVTQRGTHSLGQEAAQLLRYTLSPLNIFAGTKIWRGKAVSKEKRIPYVSSSPRTVVIHQPRYDVTFYFQTNPINNEFQVDGVLVNGWPDNDVVEQVMEVWSWPQLTNKYREVMAFLTDHPEYRRPLPTTTVKKKLNPSQIEV